jgi:hypothetical protein
MNTMQNQSNVKSAYTGILKRNKKRPFLPAFLQCCSHMDNVAVIGKKNGYSEEELNNAPEG